jgi:hypothetical protein
VAAAAAAAAQQQQLAAAAEAAAPSAGAWALEMRLMGAWAAVEAPGLETARALER